MTARSFSTSSAASFASRPATSKPLSLPATRSSSRSGRRTVIRAPRSRRRGDLRCCPELGAAAGRLTTFTRQADPRTDLLGRHKGVQS